MAFSASVESARSSPDESHSICFKEEHMKILARIIIAFVAIVAVAQAQTTWTPEMQLKVKAVGAPRVSPDGRRVVYTVNEAVMTADRSEFVTQIWMATTDGKENYQITFGDKSSSNPK